MVVTDTGIPVDGQLIGQRCRFLQAGFLFRSKRCCVSGIFCLFQIHVVQL